MPTVEELLALPYTGSSAFANGLTAADYRAQIAAHGQQFRWWKALRTPPGTGQTRESNDRVYVEQEFPEGSNVRALFYNTSRDINHPEFGPILKGHSAISVMPDECELAAGDRVSPLVHRWRFRERVKRAETGDDQLLHRMATNIIAIFISGMAAPAENYELEEGGLVHWLEDAPATGTEYLVEYRYHPLYEFMGIEQGVVQFGEDAAFLPQRGLIKVVQVTGTETTY